MARARHDRVTIASFAVIAVALATVLHEGVGHGVVSWLRGDGPTELTSNHLSDQVTDKLVSAGGTIVNLVVGAIAFAIHRRVASSTWRYGWWLFAALNLLLGAGYFLFSGVLGLGDWQTVLDGAPGYAVLRAAMAIAGAGLYAVFVWRLARAIVDYAPDALSLWIVPYLVGATTGCIAGALDPTGLALFVESTVPAWFGGTSGLVWGFRFTERVGGARDRVVTRTPAVWVAAVVIGVAYVAILGPGVRL